MAEATIITELVQVPVEKTTGVNLKLTLPEARALLYLVGYIAGDRDKSIRKYTNAIHAALATKVEDVDATSIFDNVVYARILTRDPFA